MAGSLVWRLRRVWLQVHLWLGVGLAVAILPLAASGAVLVWRGELERALEPQRFASPFGAAHLPASTYLDAGRRALGAAAPVAQIQYPEAPGEPVIVVGRTASGLRAAWLDPTTAAVRDVGDPRASALGWLHALHGNLMIPEVGRTVVGWLGLAMFLSCATGLWLWWPRNADLVGALRWRRTQSGVLNLHHVIGFWVCAPLAVLALSGVYIAFPKVVAAVRSPAAPAQEAPPHAGPIDIDAALAIARSFAPDAHPARIVLPDGPGGAWRVMMDGRTPFSVAAPAAGGEVGVEPWGDPLSRAVRATHDGDGTWLAWRFVLFAAGIGPVVLAITGVAVWLRRRIRAWRVAHDAG